LISSESRGSAGVSTAKSHAIVKDVRSTARSDWDVQTGPNYDIRTADNFPTYLIYIMKADLLHYFYIYVILHVDSVEEKYVVPCNDGCRNRLAGFTFPKVIEDFWLY